MARTGALGCGSGDYFASRTHFGISPVHEPPPTRRKAVTVAPRKMRARTPVAGRKRDVAVEADDKVELQVLGQQPVGLAVAEAAVGDEADRDRNWQRFGRTDQRMILVAVAAVLQGLPSRRSARIAAWPGHGG
jgi:hypothetical protein